MPIIKCKVTDEDSGEFSYQGVLFNVEDLYSEGEVITKAKYLVSGYVKKYNESINILKELQRDIDNFYISKKYKYLRP